MKRIEDILINEKIEPQLRVECLEKFEEAYKEKFNISRYCNSLGLNRHYAVSLIEYATNTAYDFLEEKNRVSSNYEE